MIKTLGRDFAQIRERQALVRCLIVDHAIDQNAARFGERAQPRGELNRLAKQVAMLLDGFTGAQTDPYIERCVGMFVIVVGERFLNGNSAATASAAAVNEAIIPSPVCFTSRPSCVFSALRVNALWT